MSTSDVRPYGGCTLAVGTRHGKQHQLAPAFGEVLGARLVVPHDLDTDQFGTFSGEVVRTGSALEVVRAKARLGMRVAGLSHGLASEASYEALPGFGWTRHEEIMLFVDDIRGIEVLEGCRLAMPFTGGFKVVSIAELPGSVIAALPEQGLIVRPSAGGDCSDIVKAITRTDVLDDVIATAASASDDGLALVEPDLRAHLNPSRRQTLQRLAYRLAHRLATPCPSCCSPGYGRVEVVSGLPCRVCSSPTALPLGEEHACAACPHRSFESARERWADPGDCPLCNP